MVITIDNNLLILVLSVFLLFTVILIIFLLLEINELKKQTGYLLNTMNTLSGLENYNLELGENIYQAISSSDSEQKEDSGDESLTLEKALYS